MHILLLCIESRPYGSLCGDIMLTKYLFSIFEINAQLLQFKELITGIFSHEKVI